MAAKKKTTASEQAAEVEVKEAQGQTSVEAVDTADQAAVPDVKGEDGAEQNAPVTADEATIAVPTDVSDEETPKSEKRKTVTLKAKMNIRNKPTLDAGILTVKLKGETLPIISTKGEWLEVDVDGQTAFVLYQRGKYGTIS